MPTHVLIVEGDASLSARMRSALQEQGHTAEETADGRGCLELARRHRPGVVILAVELPGGQNGYLLCGKFKKDEELKGVPVIIVGSAEGFAAHRKLKNRAEEYLPKPVQLPALVAAVDQLSAAAAQPVPARLPEEEATVSGDPDLDLIDAAFDESPPRRAPPWAAPQAAPPPAATTPATEDDFSALTGEEGPTQAAMATTPTTPPQESAPDSEPRLAQLQAALDDAQARAFSGEVRVHQLEGELEQVRQELAAARRDLELNRAHAEGAERELEALYRRAEAAEADLRESRSHSASGSGAEVEALQARVAELEVAASLHEERVARLFARLKTEEKVREKARKALAVAGQLLGEERPAAAEPAPGEGGPGEDEPAAA